MKLVDRLRDHANKCALRLGYDDAALVRAAIARIEAADELDGEMPRDLTPLTVPDNDIRSAVAAYRAIAREQDGGE